MSGPEVAGASPGAYLVQALLSLAFVIALIYAAYYVLRRLGGKVTTPTQPGPASLVQSLPLPGGNTLHVVRLGRKLHLLSSGPQGVTALASDEAKQGDADAG
jgi:flagellar biogenesis protein FliO